MTVPGTFDHTFVLDRFQREAIAALDSGRNVLVAAPTGAGKTVVGEHAVMLALRAGAKAFYTAPIKALSNQKYADLARVLGEDNVGLLTGDRSINGDAPVVVMTTEVLRNMVYAGSPALAGLRWVVLDEVHFLQDAYRGPVWEEVLMHTPASAGFVCLSATVSNADELGEWITVLRGPTETVLEHERPITLDSLYLVGDRSTERDHLVPIHVDGRPNPEGQRFDLDRGERNGQGQRVPGGGVRNQRGRRRFYTPRRLEVIERLEDEELLPTINFIFSRAGCSDAAAQCLDAGMRLTDADERSRIRTLAEARTRSLTDTDLDVLGYDRWLAALEMGIASHHAGMIPAFREAVEDCFIEGLVKVVFATETLALGINMPARSVVIERLTKFNGESHEYLTPSQFTQLTGRAGRRGIDDRGSAVVLWSPFANFAQVAALASSREFPLSSAFRPTYNMVANLVHRYDRDTAHTVLGRSFAQFQADRSSVRLRVRADWLIEQLRELDETDMESTAAAVFDPAGYRELADRVRSLRGKRPDGRAAIETSLSVLRPGDVVERNTEHGRRLLLVLSVAYRKGGAVRVRTITAQGEQVTLQLANVRGPVLAVAHVDLPVPYQPQDPVYRREAATVLRRANLRRGKKGAKNRRGPRGAEAERDAAADDEYQEYLDARDQLQAHPLHDHPDREELLEAYRARERLARDIAETEAQIARRGSSLVSRLDLILDVLSEFGHVDGWTLTPEGERLRRIYHESDLLVSLALEDGLLDDLDAPGVASIVSCITYEHRSPEAPPVPTYPTAELRQRHRRLDVLSERLNQSERRAAVERDPTTRTGVHGRGVALGGGAGAGGGARRGPHRWRLRAQREATHRPAAPTGRRRPSTPDGRRLSSRGRGVAPRCGRRRERGRGGVTIRRGQPYGETAALGADDAVAAGDDELRSLVGAAVLDGIERPTIGLVGGDLHRTLGAPRHTAVELRAGRGMRFPIDIGVVTFDGDPAPRVFVAHLVAGPRRLWAGRTVIITNAAFLDGQNVGPRAHPNDGLLDVIDGSLGFSDRRQARRRLATGTHVPHPSLAERRTAAYRVDSARALTVRLDGVPTARSTGFSVEIRPDSLWVVV